MEKREETHPSEGCWYMYRVRREGSWGRYRGPPQYQSLRYGASRHIHRLVGRACDVISDAPMADIRLNLPKRGPEPISCGHLRDDFNLPVPDRLLSLGVETGGAHWGDGVAKSVVAADYAVERGVRCAGAVSSEIDREAVGDLLVRDGSGLVGERGNNVKALGINERVLGVCGRPVEGTSAVPINLDLVVPDVRVKGFELLVED